MIQIQLAASFYTAQQSLKGIHHSRKISLRCIKQATMTVKYMSHNACQIGDTSGWRYAATKLQHSFHTETFHEETKSSGHFELRILGR